jgi:phage baseplate assembly protein W
MTTYLDLDLNFTRHPMTNDVSKKADVSAIFTSLKNLVKTANFERPFHPEIGCQVHSLLFEQMTSSVIASIQRTIKYSIENFEPRVELISVVVTPSDHRILIDLTFRILALNVVQTAKFELERTL